MFQNSYSKVGKNGRENRSENMSPGIWFILIIWFLRSSKVTTSRSWQVKLTVNEQFLQNENRTHLYLNSICILDAVFHKLHTWPWYDHSWAKVETQRQGSTDRNFNPPGGQWIPTQGLVLLGYEPKLYWRVFSFAHYITAYNNVLRNT